MKLIRKENNTMFFGDWIEDQEVVFSVLATHKEETMCFYVSPAQSQEDWLEEVELAIDKWRNK